MKNPLPTRLPTHRKSHRPLLCEQLERRYALHGMGWFESSADRYEFIETTVYEESSGFRYAQVRSVSYSGRASARPEPKLVEGEDGSNRFRSDELSDSHLTDDYFERHDCSRMRNGLGLGEGEASDARSWSGRPDGSPGFDRFQAFPTSSVPAASVPASLLPPALSPVTSPARNDTSRQTNNDPKSEAARPQEPKPTSNVAAVIQVVSQSGNRSVDAALRAVQSTPRSLGNSASFGSQDNVRLTGIFNIGSYSDPAQGSAPSRVESLTSGRNIDLLHATFTDGSPTVSLSSSANASGASSMASTSGDALRSSYVGSLSGSSNTATTGQRGSDMESNWQRSSQRTAATSNSTSTSDIEGLRDQLRSVIDKIASEPATEKLSAERKAESASSDRLYGQMAGIDKRMMPVTDGMLELGPAVDRMSPIISDAGDGAHLRNALPQHTQLFASLELNREFELAGPSVRADQSLMDAALPSERVNLVAEVISQWTDQPNDSNAADDARVVSETTWWQQLLLPVGFLAISGLLIRSRNRYLRRVR